MPCPNVARWVSAARPTGRKSEAARLRGGLQALQSGEGLKEDFIYPFTLSSVSSASILMTIITCLPSHICKCFNSGSCSFKVNMNKNNVKYLQGINFS